MRGHLARKPEVPESIPTSDFRLPTSDFRLPTSDFRLPTSLRLLAHRVQGIFQSCGRGKIHGQTSYHNLNMSFYRYPVFVIRYPKIQLTILPENTARYYGWI